MNLPNVLAAETPETIDFTWMTEIFEGFAAQIKAGVVAILKASLPVQMAIVAIVVVAGVVIYQARKTGKVAHS